MYVPYTLPHLSLQVPPAALDEYKGKFPEEPFYGSYYTPTLYPRATYAAMITYLDTQVGHILEELDKNGLTSNTVVMFSSDNGPTFKIGGFDPTFFDSAGGLRGLKTDVYEGGIREPFIAKWPGHIKAGAVTDVPSVQYDLMATLADLLDIKNPPKSDGISFLPTLLGHPDQQKKHDFFYWEFPEKGGQLAIRIGDWKGVKQGLRANENAPWELYNLATDRNETKNVAAEHPEILKEMDVIGKREHTCPHIREWEIIDPKFDPELVAPRKKAAKPGKGAKRKNLQSAKSSATSAGVKATEQAAE